MKWKAVIWQEKVSSWQLSVEPYLENDSEVEKSVSLKTQRMKFRQSSNCMPLSYRFPNAPQVFQPLAMVPVRITGLRSLPKQPLPKGMPGIRPAIVSLTFSTTAEAWRKLPPSSSPPHSPSPPPRPTHGDVRKEADQAKAVRNGVSSSRSALPSISCHSTSWEPAEGFPPESWWSPATASYLCMFFHLWASKSQRNERWMS